MTVTELTLSDAFAAGFVGSFGALAIVIGLILFVMTVKSAMSGMMPAAMICGMALISLLIGPALGLAVAIAARVIFAIKGDVYTGGQAVLGWLLSLVITFVVFMAAAMVGAVIA